MEAIGNQPIRFGTAFMQMMIILSVVGMQIIQTTIRMGQNMQMYHSLRCKQIGNYTGRRYHISEVMLRR